MNTLNLARKVITVMRNDGVEGLASKLVQRANKRWGGDEPFHLAWEDVADSTTLDKPPVSPERKEPGTPLSIGWLISVPGPASGGHTTIFRMVEALEEAGHRCILFIYEPGGGDAVSYADLIRTWWPKVRAEIRPVAAGMPDLDAYVATAWQTAHVLARRAYMAGERFYFAQDYEPYFYPNGAVHEMAEDSYRFGFRMITMGRMISDELRARFNTEAVALEFGCDTDVYSVTNGSKRNGVVFYAKPGVPRRGYELGIATLARFHSLRPHVPIHTFGITARGLPFPAVVHSHLTPRALNELYNSCTAGLALSFTNVSLIPYELLAAGVVPVANDWDGCRTVLDNRHVVWARARPDALAAGLVRAVDAQPQIGASTLNSSVTGTTWNSAQNAVVQEFERVWSRGAADRIQ